MGNTALYEELVQVRQEIRSQLRDSNVRDISVCSDEALRIISQRLPQTVEEMRAIPGLSSIFINNYSTAFLAVIQSSNYKQPMQDPEPEVRKEIEKTQARLLNVGKNNPLLWIHGMSPRQMADMSLSANADKVQALLCSKIPSLVVCNTNDTSQCASQTQAYKYFAVLCREAEREKVRTGKETLYIGYPLAIGTLNSGVKIRAPLAFFPVLPSIGSGIISFKIDKSRPVLCNTSISAATGAIYGVSEISSAVTGETDLERILADYYRGQGITLSFHGGTLVDFAGLSGESSSQQHNWLDVYNVAVCGRFPVHDAAVQVDCQVMRERGQITPLINRLFEPSLFDPNLEDLTDDIDERRITVCPLTSDASQRKAVAASASGDIVVTGAPDTGVMQTVANTILQTILDTPTAHIAVVSEQPGALDKLLDRLGPAAGHVVKICDASRPTDCIKRITDVLDRRIPVIDASGEEKEKIKEIDRAEAAWEEYVRAEYHTAVHGVSASELYRKGIEYDVFAPGLLVRVPELLRCAEPSLMRMSLSRLMSVSYKYSIPGTIACAERVWALQKKVPMLRYINRTLYDCAIQELAELVDEVKSIGRRSRQRRPLLKRLIKDTTAQKAKAIADRFFELEHTDKWHIILETPDEYIPALVKLYRQHRTATERMGHTSPLEWDYYCSMERLIAARQAANSAAANELLRRVLIYSFIREHKEQSSAYAMSSNELKALQQFVLGNTGLRSQQLLNEAVYNLERRRVRFVTSPAGSAAMHQLTVPDITIASLRPAVKNLMQGLSIWAVTPDALSSVMPLDSGLFDLVVYLNAGQMRAERALPSLYRARKVLVAGDPCQTLSRRSNFEEARDESLLDLVTGKISTVQLSCYYGAGNSDVVRYASERFYNDGISVIDDARLPKESGLRWIYVPEAEWKNNCNEKEAIAAVDATVECLRKNPDCDIAILSFSTRQRERMALLLGERAKDDPEFNRILNNRIKKLFVADVDDACYETHDVVIASTAITPSMTTNPEEDAVWFKYFSDSAICTVCTRARSKLILISSVTSADIAAFTGPYEPLSGLWGLLNFAKQHQRSEHPVTAEPAIEAIRDAISIMAMKQGLTVEYDVGVGMHTVDIAVVRGDRYVLGLLIDTPQDTNAMDTMTRHADRLQFLAARGWRTHLLRMRDWCEDRAHEEVIISELIAEQSI